MPLLKRAAPFDDPDWLFELKYDGFRALAVIEHGRAQLLSRNGHSLSFVGLGTFGATCTGSVLEQCFRLRHPSIPGLSRPGALLRSVCYATKLSDNCKKLQIRNPQKTVKDQFLR